MTCLEHFKPPNRKSYEHPKALSSFDVLINKKRVFYLNQSAKLVLKSFFKNNTQWAKSPKRSLYVFL